MKLPNPPILTDGKDPEFEDWESRMRNKLKANSDHYYTEALRMAYVENRVGGKAAKHLRPRLRVDAVNPYTTTEEMLKHLETIFRDPNKEANAKRDFRKLNMRATDKFQDFLTSFLHLAGEAKIPDTMYKDELYQRITWKLQEMTVKESMDSEVDFDAYTAICTKLADHLSVINESRRLGSKSNISTSRAAENTEVPMSRTETRKREGTPSGTAFRTTDILLLQNRGREHSVASSPRRRRCLVSETRPDLDKGRGSDMLKCLVYSHVDNIKEVVIMKERRVENIIILSTEM